MSEIVKIVLPKLGESIVGATVVQWLKKEGDYVALDDPLVEVSTDKVNSEIPSPYAGILKEIVATEDQEIAVGDLLATIEITAEATDAKKIVPNPSPCPLAPSQTSKEKEDVFSPAVLRIAQTEGISFETLRNIEGTGESGRITKKDLEAFLERRSSTSKEVSQVQSSLPEKEITSLMEERIKMSGLRKAIADNMVRSFYEAPHASLVTEVDVTEVMNLISKEKDHFLQMHGVKLTITSFLVQALTEAVQKFPMLNASLEQETIILKKYVNVGIAVNVDKGVVVPVIKQCQNQNLENIAKSVGDLALRARGGKLAHNDVTDGTITLTNFGMTGALMGVPIIRFPEVAIVGAGTIQKRVVVRDDDSFAVRRMMYLTLTFDHRIIDGIYGCEFLDTLKQRLENPKLH